MFPKNLFFIKLLILSLLLHVLGCFILLFVYLDYNPKALLQVSSAHSQAIVRVVSFSQKSKSRTSKAVASSGLNGHSTQSVAHSQKIVLKKTTATKKRLPKKKAVQKQKQLSKKGKNVPFKKQKEKVSVKSKSIEKKIDPVSQEEKKVEVPVQEVVEKTSQSVDQAVVEDLPLREIQEVSYQEFNFMQLQEAFQEAVARVWSPPAGMSQSLVCQVVLTVGWDGKLIEKRIEVPSDILVYDIAVEQALDEIEMPSELWGKSVRVAFKP